MPPSSSYHALNSLQSSAFEISSCAIKLQLLRLTRRIFRRHIVFQTFPDVEVATRTVICHIRAIGQRTPDVVIEKASIDQILDGAISEESRSDSAVDLHSLRKEQK